MMKEDAPETEEKARKISSKEDSYKWDVFISHASEDKDEIARPLAEELTKNGVKGMV